MKDPNEHSNKPGIRYYQDEKSPSGFRLIGTYQVNTSVELFCRQVKNAWVDASCRTQDKLWYIEPTLLEEVNSGTGKIEISVGQVSWLFYRVDALAPAVAADPLVRVHSVCYLEPAVDILKQMDERLYGIYARQWRDDVPGFSGALLDSKFRPVRKGGRPRDPLFDDTFEEMEKNGWSVREGWQYYVTIPSETRKKYLQDDQPKDFDRFRIAMKRRKDEKGRKIRSD